MLPPEGLAIWFTPGAIRQHFEDDGSYMAQFVARATDEDLTRVGQWCLGSDVLYKEFHKLLCAGVKKELLTETS